MTVGKNPFFVVKRPDDLPYLLKELQITPYNQHVEMKDRNGKPLFGLFWKGFGETRVQKRGLVWCTPRMKIDVLALIEKTVHEEQS